MSNSLGKLKSIFYSDVCGQINTEKTWKLAFQWAYELNIKKLIVASETGLSAIKAADMLRDSGVNPIVVTSAAGTKIENTVIGDLKIGIPDKKIWNELEKRGAKIARATDPFWYIGAALEEKGFPTLGTLIRLCMRIISSGTAICIVAATMANDNGLLKDGEEVVAVAGSWIGLDTAAVVRATNSVSLLKGEPCK